MSRWVYLTVHLVLVLVLVSGCGSKAPGKPGSHESVPASASNKGAPSIGETKKQAAIKVDPNKHMNSCSKCHFPDKSVRKINNHPPLTPKVTFGDCAGCHLKEPDKKEKFKSKIHDIHMNSKSFVSKYINNHVPAVIRCK